jgi:hypothetical protein
MKWLADMETNRSEKSVSQWHQLDQESIAGNHKQSWHYKKLQKRFWCTCSKIRICVLFMLKELLLCKRIFSWRGELEVLGVVLGDCVGYY